MTKAMPRVVIEFLTEFASGTRPLRESLASRGLSFGRVLRVFMLSVTALLLLLASANLRLQLMLRSRAREAGVELRYRAAYMLRPGVVDVRDLDVRSTSRLPWRVGTQRARFHVGLVDLAFGRLHVRRLEADALEVRVAGIAEDDIVVPGPVRNVVTLGVTPFLDLPDERGLTIAQFESRVTKLQVGDYVLTGSLELHAKDVSYQPREPVLGEASLILRNASLRKNQEELLSKLNGQVGLRRGQSLELDSSSPIQPVPNEARLTGTFHLAGTNTSELLTFANVPGELCSLFNAVDGRAFTLEAKLEQQAGALWVREFHAQSEGFQAVGAFRDTPLERAGVFLLSMRNVSAGVLIGARDASFVLGADTEWLSHSKQLLGLAR